MLTRRHVLTSALAAPAVLRFGTGTAHAATTLKISHQFPGGTIDKGDFRDRLCRVFAAEVATGAPLAASLEATGQPLAARDLRAKSDLWLDDIDLFFPYDGFSIVALRCFESYGFCRPGEAGKFLADNWDTVANRIMINGRVPVNTHGGSLSEGGSQGAGHLREAVTQLRGQAGHRQVPGARVALLTPGGFFFNAQGLVLRAG
jgi:acetyl-CoA acetyltransferase